MVSKLLEMARKAGEKTSIKTSLKARVFEKENKPITSKEQAEQRQVVRDIRNTNKFDNNIDKEYRLYEQQIVLGLFLKVYCDQGIQYGTLTSEQIHSIRGTLLYKQAEEVSKVFETKEEEDSYNKVICNSIAFLDKYRNKYLNTVDINSVTRDIGKYYMGHFSKEKRQKDGAVYTPPEIVKWIHDKLEEHNPITLEKTYWDPACGTGRFPIDWYDPKRKREEDVEKIRKSWNKCFDLIDNSQLTFPIAEARGWKKICEWE